ncbi:MAG: hypothetical protein DRP47_05310, partial [Candidatus Zixiibacteriota bacterium]
MKRNSKFLLMLTLLIGIVGFSFVGCDDTTIEDNPVVDKVVGSIEGVVYKNAGYCAEGAIGADVWVYWMSDEVRDSVVTDEMGYFLIPGPLASGDYALTFKYVPQVEETVDGTAKHEDGSSQALQAELSYMETHYTATIPTLDQLKDDIDAVPSGEYEYRYTTGVCGPDVYMYEKAATVTGRLYSAVPDTADEWGYVSPKDISTGEALQGDHHPISAIGDIEVIITYPEDLGFAPRSFPTWTSPEGYYTFTGLPVYNDSVMLTIPAFAYGDTSYQQFDTTIYLMCDRTVTVPDIYDIIDCRSLPVVLDRSFKKDVPFHNDSDLVIWFSEPMDTLTFDCALLDDGNNTQFEYAWSSNDSILTIDPRMALKTGTDYTLRINYAKAKSGCLLDEAIFGWLTFTTMDGIKLMATNVETSPGVFIDFQIGDPITLTFNMTPIIDPIYGTLTLTDITEGFVDYPVAFDSAVAGSVLTIIPRDDLELSHKYEVCYKVFSDADDIYSDWAEGCIEFYTEIDPVPPVAVTGWACNEPTGWRADWNTKSIAFKWNKVDRAIKYYVYAYDNKPENPNTDFVEIAEIDAADYLQYQEATVTLPAQFDRYTADGIQTPFTDSTHVWFMIRAWNQAGLSPHSDTLEFWDTTPPGAGNTADGGNLGITFSQTYGSGDNTIGADEDTVWIGLDNQLEYMERTSNPTWDFVEAGGDESYVLPEANGIWNWRNDSRLNDYDNASATGAYFTVPAGACAAGDELWLTFSDNSGNDTTIQINLDLVQPYITYTAPVTNDTVEAPNHTVTYTIQQAPGVTAITWVDYWLTLDAGTTMIDSLEDFCNDGSGTRALEDF